MANTTKITRQPENISLLENNKFKFTIPNLSWAVYFCQSATLPGVGTTSAIQYTPFHDMKRHGDRLVYQPLVITALIDEDLYTWEQTFNWLQSITTPQGFQQYGKGVDYGIYNDGILEFNKNSNLSNLRIKFHNCVITDLGQIQMQSDVTEPEQLLSDITIDYDTFTVERLDK